MYHYRLLFFLIALSSALFMVIGLYKPWAMLWWEDVQNRKKVILVYGSVCVFFFAIYIVLGLVL
jgi:hypothetical protein